MPSLDERGGLAASPACGAGSVDAHGPEQEAFAVFGARYEGRFGAARGRQASSATFPPAAVVFTVTVCSAQKRTR